MSDTFALVVPPHSIRWLPPGQDCHDAQTGDELLVKHNTILADAITIGQDAMALTRPQLRGYTSLDHNAFIRGSKDGRTMVSEMGPKGYERRPLYDYVAHMYAVVHYEVADEQRSAAVAFDEAMKDVDYGWEEYVDDILDGLTHLKFVGSWGDNIICSTHLTLVTMAMGFMPALMPSAVVPAHRAMWLQAQRPR